MDAAFVLLQLLPSVTGVRHLRSMVTERSFRVFQLDRDDYTYIG